MSNVLTFRLKENAYAEVDAKPIGRGSNFITYRGEMFDSTFSKGKKVILKVFSPFIGTNEEFEFKPITDNKGMIFAFQFLPAQKEQFFYIFIQKYIEMQCSFQRLQCLLKENTLRGNIVDLYDTYDCFFDAEFIELSVNRQSMEEYLKGSSPSEVEKIDCFYSVSLYYDDNFDADSLFETTNSITEILDIMIHSADIIQKLHSINVVHMDIKPSNFLYNRIEILGTHEISVKMLDTDTIVNDPNYNKQQLSTAEPFSPPEAYDGYYGKASDVYMLAASLVHWLFSEEIVLKSTYDENGHKLLNMDVLLEENNMYSLKDSLCPRRSERCGDVDCFKKDLSVLKDIFECRGIHPEIMLDKARERAEAFGKDNKPDERLFPEIIVEANGPTEAG